MKSNNLKQLEKDLKIFAKRVKDFKYTDSALITFLMTGMVSVTNNLFSATTDKNLENQKQEISTSIKNIHQKVKETRKENNKLLKSTNLELIQLMEQGEQVIKSPWSSWQFGTGYYFNSVNQNKKNSGEKSQKYTFNAVFQRDLNEMNRYITNESKYYDSFLKGNNNFSTLNNARAGLNYGLTDLKLIIERPTNMEVNAGIKPKLIDKQDIIVNLPPKNLLELPETVSFNPIQPDIKNPATPALPKVPTYKMHLGSNCNNSWTVCHTTGGNVGAKISITPAISANSQQNIPVRMNYTTINGIGNILLVFRIEPDNNSKISYGAEII